MLATNSHKKVCRSISHIHMLNLGHRPQVWDLCDALSTCLDLKVEPTLRTAASFSAGEISSRNHGFSPKENVPMNILKSIHPIHKPDAFSKAESRLHVGASQSKDNGPGCGGTSLLAPIQWSGAAAGRYQSSQAVPAPPAHPATFLYPVLFFGCDINNNVFLYIYNLPDSLHIASHLILGYCEDRVIIIPVLHLSKQTCARESSCHGW